MAFQDPFIIAKEQVHPYTIPTSIPFYTKPKRGKREKQTIPTIQIIGTLTGTRLPVIASIGNPYTATHPATLLIYHPETHHLPILQEIVSQKTIDEAEYRLNQVIKRAKQIDLTEINTKLKIVSHAIKRRYEQTQNKQIPPN